MSIRVCLGLLASLPHRPIAKMLRRNRLRGFVRGTAALSAVLCLGAAGAQAAILTVSSTSDAAGSATTPGTLRYALSNLDSGMAANTNTINITATGTITLTSALPPIVNGVTITGPGANLLTISGAGAYQVFNFSGSAQAVSIAGLTIANGSGSGGGIAFYGQALTVTGCTFSGNSTTYGGGGGIAAFGLSPSNAVTVTNSTFSGNSSINVGGGIMDVGPNIALTVVNSTFSGNSAASGGGGIAQESAGGTLTVVNSTFSGNSANQGGGGIINEDSASAMTVVNSTFSGNSAASGGGGIAQESAGGTLTVVNSTFSGNSASNGGGGVYNESATVSGEGNNVFYNNTGGNSFGFTLSGTDVTANPHLMPLGWYGGPTQTMLPLPGSAAICAGTATPASPATLPAADQRGWPMNSSCVDAGAAQTNYLTVTTLADSTNSGTTCTGGATCSLRDAIGLANTATSSNGTGADIDFLASLTSVASPGTINLGSGLAIGGDANIAGPGANQLTVSGGNSTAVGSVFTVNSGATAALYGLTVANGNSAGNGGGILNSGTLTLLSSAVSGNSVSGGGSTGTAGNSEDGDGFLGGNAYDGGGIYNAGALTILDSTISGNTAAGAGGTGGAGFPGVPATGNGGNGADGGNGSSGGGIYNAGSLTIAESTISGNATTGAGGAGGTGGNGGNSGTYDNGGNGSNGGNAGSGGGIYNAGSLTIADSTISGNATTGAGGTGGAGGNGGNSGSNDSGGVGGNGGNAGTGGGIYNAGTLSITDTTVSGNAATGALGAAGAAGNAGTGGVSGDAGTSGSAASAGGIMNAGTLTVANSIVEGNSVGAGASYADLEPAGGSYTDNGGSYVNTSSSGTATTPALAVLGNYGGTTQTMVPLPGSPAICAGSSTLIPAGTTTDQRGYSNGTPTYCSPGQVDAGAVQTWYSGATWATQPSNTLLGSDISPAPVVDVVETDPTTNATDNVPGAQVTIAPGNGLALTSGTLTEPPAGASGQPTAFGNLLPSSAGTGFTLSTNPITITGSNTLPSVTSNSFNVIGPVSQLVVSAPSTATAGTPFSITVTAEDASGNVVPNATGDVISVYSNGSVLQTSFTYTSAMAGIATLNDAVTLTGSGNQTLTAELNSNPSIEGTSGNIAVSAAATAYQIVVSGFPTTVYAGQSETGTVTLEDQYGNVETGFSGSVFVTTSENAAISVPLNNGTGTFTASFATAAASQSITPSLSTYKSVPETGITVNAVPSYVVTTASDDATGTASNCPNGGGGANCSLRDALAAAAAATVGNISFSPTVFTATNTVAQNTITLTGGSTLTISSNTAIAGLTSGSGASLKNLVTVDGGSGNDGAFSVFTVNSGTTASIAHLNIQGGDTSGGGGGGGISNWGALTVANSTIESNSALEGYGGGISNNGTLTVANSTIESNSALAGYGGGISNGGTLTVTGSTITGNSANIGGVGGGVFNDNGGTLTVTGSTIYGNSVTYGVGGGIYNFSGGTFSLANSIVAGNTAAGGIGPDADNPAGTFTDNGGNLIGISGAGSGNTGFTAGTTHTGTVAAPLNPNLSQLGAFGGTTQTMLPLPNSPAICAGNYTAAQTAGMSADQRGVAFGNTGAGGYCPAGSIDIGAVQTDYAMTFTGNEPGSSQTSGVAFNAGVTLTENALPVSGVSIPVTASAGTLSGSPVSSATNASGVASYTLTLTNSAALSGVTLKATLPAPPTLTATSSQFELIGPVSQLVVSAPSTATAGTAFSVTVTAEDASGDVVPDYTGTVHFTTSDTGASVSLPGDYTFVAGDNGAHTFTNGATLVTAGGQTISAADSAHSLNGTSNSISVSAATAYQVVVSGFPTAVYAGLPETGTVTLEDQYGNTETASSGSASVTTSENATAISVPLTNGVGTFTTSFATPAASQSITPSLGTYTRVAETGITVSPVPSYVVTTTTDAAPGEASNCPNGGGSGACSLRDALTAAQAAGAGNISFSPTVFTAANTVTQNTITLTGGSALTIPSNTAITGLTSGSGASLKNLVTVDGGGGNDGAFSVFTVNSGTTASIAHLNIQGGYTDTIGGGIFNSGTLTVTGSTIENCFGSDGISGGIYNRGTLTVTDSTISNNSITERGSGGGVYNDNGGKLTVTGSTISGNSANSGGVGGGIVNTGTLTVTGSTITGNSANSGGVGGGIYNAGTLTVIGSTISGNSANGGGVGGGIYNFSGGTFTLVNSIVAGNTAQGGSGPDAYSFGSFTDGGGNLIGDGSAKSGITNGVNGDQVGTSASPINPDLSALGNYGGTTQTMLPLPGSPAICAASYTAAQTAGMSADQRGVAFGNTGAGGYCPAGSIDIGAVQTDYAIKFVQQPSTAVQNVAMSPAPTVELTENGSAFADGTDTVAIPLTLTTGSGTLSGGSASTSASTGIATYSGLSVSLPGTGDVLTAGLALNPGTTPATALSLASNPFNVDSAVTQLAFSTAPASTVKAGGNAGAAVAVQEEDVNGALVTTAGDTITLAVTGPGGYSKTYTQAATAGVASFDLAAAQLTAEGPYSYTASISTAPSVTDAIASETVGAAAAASVTVVSGSNQSAVIGAAFASPLTVKVEDQYNNPVQDATVIFSAPGSGAGASFSTPAATAADGTTSATATANGTAATTAYSVTASVSGVTTPASFMLTNTKHSTTLTVAPTSTALVYGQPVTVNASIVPASVSGSVPTGSVTFYDGSTELSPASNVSSAAASFAISVPAVGSHTYAAQYGGDGNFQPSSQTSATENLVVSAASSTLNGPASESFPYGAGGTVAISVSGQYSGAGIATPSGTVSYTIGGGTPLTAVLTAGSATLTIPSTQPAGNYTVAVSYAGDGNYNAATTINVPVTVKQAAATIAVTPYSVTYDAAAHTATGTATGVGGVNLAADLNLTATTHTAAGTYNGDAWSFHDPTGNYADASGTVNDRIGTATATIAVTPYSVTYDATAHTATGTATGVGGVNLAADLNLTATTHTAAGTYSSDAWSFHDPSGNYADASGTVNDRIGTATATIAVTPYSVTYDATAHTATGTATGVGGVNLAADLNLTATTHTAAGAYSSDAWSFHDPTGNYADASGTVNDHIGTATATIAVTPYSVIYDATAHTATGTATGVGGVNLAADLNLTATMHTAAGTYNSDAWSFHDPTGNYADASGTVNDHIGTATATIAVTPYSVIYDATAHTATGTATGVDGVNLAADLNLTATTHTAAGTYSSDAWSFHDPSGNYADASGTVNDHIGMATLTITAANATKVYGTANPAFTGTVTGQQGSDAFAESFTTGAVMSSPVGSYSIVPVVTGTNLADYTQSVTDGTLTVTQAGSSTILQASSASITPDQSVTLTATVRSATSGTPTGTVNFYDGTTLLNTTPAPLTAGVAAFSTAALTPGAVNSITATYSGDVNFTPSSSTAGATQITVAPLDFVMTLQGPSNLTVVPGQSISYTVQVTPDYGSYAGTVNFAIAGLPPGATVSFSPSSIAANGGTQTVTVTIKTAAATAQLDRRPPSRGRRMAPFALGFLLLFGAGTLRKRGRKLRGLLCVLALAGAGAVAGLTTGCGTNSGFFAQAPQNYTVTLTATAANLQHSTTITLNVQ